jgi:hypothetical protein
LGCGGAAADDEPRHARGSWGSDPGAPKRRDQRAVSY